VSSRAGLGLDVGWRGGSLTTAPPSKIRGTGRRSASPSHLALLNALSRTRSPRRMRPEVRGSSSGRDSASVLALLPPSDVLSAHP
jgi:hypothetical protein